VVWALRERPALQESTVSRGIAEHQVWREKQGNKAGQVQLDPEETLARLWVLPAQRVLLGWDSKDRPVLVAISALGEFPEIRELPVNRAAADFPALQGSLGRQVLLEVPEQLENVELPDLREHRDLRERLG